MPIMMFKRPEFKCDYIHTMFSVINVTLLMYIYKTYYAKEPKVAK